MFVGNVVHSYYALCIVVRLRQNQSPVIRPLCISALNVSVKHRFIWHIVMYMFNVVWYSCEEAQEDCGVVIMGLLYSCNWIRFHSYVRVSCGHVRVSCGQFLCFGYVCFC